MRCRRRRCAASARQMPRQHRVSDTTVARLMGETSPNWATSQAPPAATKTGSGGCRRIFSRFVVTDRATFRTTTVTFRRQNVATGHDGWPAGCSDMPHQRSSAAGIHPRTACILSAAPTRLARRGRQKNRFFRLLDKRNEISARRPPRHTDYSSSAKPVRQLFQKTCATTPKNSCSFFGF